MNRIIYYSNVFTVVEWNHDIDRVHVLFKACPNTEISKFMNAYKSASSRLIKIFYLYN